MTHRPVALVVLAALLGGAAEPRADNWIAGSLIELNDNGAWSWFMDERAIVTDGRLLVGSVRSHRKWGAGNVEIAALDLDSGEVRRIVLHEELEADDHDGPALLPLPDGSVLASYARHGRERKIYVGRSSPGAPLAWGSVRAIETPGTRRTDNVTYANLFHLPSGRIANFYRGRGYDPNLMTSDDLGETWIDRGRVLRGRDGYGPYLKYFADASGDVHLVATEDHPRHFDNSIYHGIVRGDSIYDSFGSELGELGGEVATWELTPVFVGDADHVAWMTDLELDRAGRPYVAFSVQRSDMDLRYYQARWDGEGWHAHEMAYAGTRLYAQEDDYAGLATLDPRDPDVVYISTNADPETGAPLMSCADGRRHHELYRGLTIDGGASWSWEPITANSTVDNLRPIVPRWDDARTALVWMRGDYLNNHGGWTTSVVAIVMAGGQLR